MPSPLAVEVRALSRTYEVHERPPDLAAALRSVFRRKYTTVHAVQDLSFTVEPGERVGFLGPNGAGKTTTLGLVPLSVAFHARPELHAWTSATALVVVGWFSLLKGILDGAINPSLFTVVDQIRQGTLDFVLASLALLACATLVLYSIWILVVAAAFWVVRLDNLAYLFNSVFDFARWPVSALRVVFMFVLPLGIMTTYPAEALLGTLSLQTALLSVAGALTFALISRAVWTRALGRYTSASS